jgi:SAM-dependent methyltransferase
MPTIEENKKQWDGGYDWSNLGDEWSAGWGGAAMQWHGSIYPRIHSHLPAGRILEIACGCGRWTQYLKNHCHHLIAVDISEECIQTCRRRFSGAAHIEYHVNDGKSLDMIADSSIDLLFSFDSLVHAGAEVLEAYLREAGRILSNDGVAFIHHSNLGEYRTRYSRIRSVPKLEGLLNRLGIAERPLGWRDLNVDARSVEASAEAHGLTCVSQEIVTWETKRLLTDCMSTIVRKTSSAARSNRVLRNRAFMTEAGRLQELSQLYG